MSLVTTPRDSRSPSARHSAATSAVLPEPTGPPMPTRSGPASRVRCACGSWLWSPLINSPPGQGSRREQGHLAAALPLGEQIEERIAVVRQLRPGTGGRAGRGGGHLLDLVGQR